MGHLDEQEDRERSRPGGGRCRVEEVEETLPEEPAPGNDRDRKQERVGESTGERALY